jgi:hypothetical protein
MVWCFFGYGLDDDDALALGGHISSYCGGLSWHVVVYLVVIGLVRLFTCCYHL